MKTIGAMSMEDLDHLIEQKILEIFGDPDSGLELREDFQQTLNKRLAANAKLISHEQAVKKFG